MTIDPKVMQSLGMREAVTVANPLPAVADLSPDDAAEGVRLHRQSGIGSVLATRNLPKLRADDEQRRWNELVKSSPQIAKRLQEPAVAAMARDDMTALSALEPVLQFGRDLKGSAKAGLYQANRGAAGMFRATYESAAGALDPLVGNILPVNPLRVAAEGWQGFADQSGRVAAQARPKVEGVAAAGFFGGVESLAANALILPLAFAPGGQAAALTGMSSITGGNAYQDARNKGLSPAQSVPFAASQAAIEYATEKLPLTRLLSDVKAGTPFFQTLARNIALEIPGEQAATVLQDLNEWAVLNPEKPFRDYLNERPSAAAQTLISTVVSAGGQTAIVQGIETAAQRISARADVAQRAEQDAEALRRLGELSASSKLRGRDAATFEALVQDASAGAPVQDVFVDARTLTEVLNQSGNDVTSLPPSVVEQLSSAEAIGSDVRIGIAEYAARIAGTPLDAMLLQHLRTDPDGMTLAEAQAFYQSGADDFMSEAERTLTAEQDGQTARASSQRVFDTMLSQLTTTGRFTNDANRKYSTLVQSFYEATADRLSVTPDELYQRFPLSVTAQTQEGVDVLEQGPRASFDPAGLNVTLLESADLTSFLHESGHAFLEITATLAAEQDAPAVLQSDMQTLLRWMGHEGDAASWRAQSVEQRRAAHERFAQSFEQYLFEGTAPSVELESVFRSFRNWLARVYRSLEAFTGANRGAALNPEVRAVMGRMLATDEAISTARRLREMGPMFATAEQAEQMGMSAEEFDEYARLWMSSQSSAQGQINARSLRDMKWFRNAQAKALKVAKAETAGLRAEVREQVAAEIDAQPVYRAARFLRRGEAIGPDGEAIQVTEGHKLNTEALTAMFPAGELGAVDWSPLKKGGRYAMASKDGLHPDAVAEIFGYPSGRALVLDLLNAPAIDDAIEAETDARLMALYGDINSEEALQRAADEAVHNDAHVRAVATELAAIRGMMPARGELLKAARYAVGQMLGRRRLRNLSPSQFAAAEARATKQADAAMAKGDRQGAARAKQDQVFNALAVRGAYDAQAEVTQGMREFRSMFEGSDKDRAKTRNMDFVNAARAVLSNFGIGTASDSAAAYLEKVREYDPDIYASLADAVAFATRTGQQDIQSLTLNEFRDLREAVGALWELSRASMQVEIEGVRMERAAVVEQLNSRLREEFPNPPNDMTRRDPTERDKARVRLMGIRSALRRVEAWADARDGLGGAKPFTRFIWRPVVDGINRYRTAKKDYVRRYLELVKSVEKDLTAYRIEAPELEYTFGSKANLLHAILHSGNASNLQKLLRGRSWGEFSEDGTLNTARWDAFMARMHDEGVVTKRDMDFVQGVWDLLEEMKPAAQKAHRSIYGRYFAEVTAEPLQTPFGQYRGGYVPALTDPFIVTDAAINQAREQVEQGGNSFMFPTAGSGFTKGRVENYAKPLMLDLRMLSSHIDKVLRFSHIEQPVRDVARIVSDSRFKSVMERVDMTVIPETLLPWLQRSAQQQVETPLQGKGGQAVSRFFRGLRNRTGMQVMFFNVVNTMQQATGFSVAALKVPPSYLARSMWQTIRAPKQSAADVSELSEAMSNRLGASAVDMLSTIDDLLLDPSKYERARDYAQKHAYFMQQGAQNFIDTVVWRAAYDYALSQNPDGEADAIKQADATVRQTQGSMAAEDVSRVEASNAFVRAFLQFYNYFNGQANLLGSEYVKTVHEMGLKKSAPRLLFIYTAGFMIPAVMAEVIVQAMRGGPDDDDDDGLWDEWLAVFFGAQARTLTAMVPVAGQTVNAGLNVWNDKWYDDRISTAPSISLLESATRAPYSVYRAMEGEGSDKRAVKDTLTALGLMTGLPLYALGRPVGYAMDVEAGRAEPSGPIDYARGLVTGR
jgi:hypothetical protein